MAFNHCRRHSALPVQNLFGQLPTPGIRKCLEVGQKGLSGLPSRFYFAGSQPIISAGPYTTSIMIGVDGDLSLEVHLILSPRSSFPFPDNIFLLFIFCLWQLDKLVITKDNRPAHDKSPHDEKHSREQRDSHVNSDDQSPQQIENKATEQNSAADRESTTSSNLNPFYSQRISNMLKCLDSRRMKPRISQK